MYDQQQHEMELETAHPSGAEEWVCHTCGRRFMMRWEPFERVIMEPGDEYASHTGGKGGLRIGATQPAQEDPALAEGLRPWLKGLKNLGLDDLLNQTA